MTVAGERGGGACVGARPTGGLIKDSGASAEDYPVAGLHDFGPMFACEQLAKRHQIEVSKETVRQWMTAEGIWQSKEARAKTWGALTRIAIRCSR